MAQKKQAIRNNKIKASKINKNRREKLMYLSKNFPDKVFGVTIFCKK